MFDQGADPEPQAPPGASPELKVLIVEDSNQDAELMVRELKRHGFRPVVRQVCTRQALQAALAEGGWDVVISDYAMPQFTGLDALACLRETGIDIPFLLVSGTVGEDLAVEALKAGANDYLLKDRLARLGVTVRRELREAEERRGRARAESALRLQTSALNAAANAIVILDRAGRIEWVNPAFCRLSGYGAEEVLGRDPEALSGVAEVDPGHPGLSPVAKEALSAGGVWRGERVRRRRDGTRYVEDVTITPVVDEKGDVGHFVAIIEDVTMKREAEGRLREQAALIEAASDAIVVWSADLEVRLWNRGAEALFRVPREQAIGQRITGLVEYEPHAFEAATTGLQERGQWSGELTLGSGPKRRLVHCGWTRLRDSGERGGEVLAIHTDVTEKRELEAQFLQAQRLEGIGALASGVAHDMNNILAPIQLIAPMLREMVEDRDGHAMLETVDSCARRGAAMVRQLLTFARGAPGARVPLPLQHLVREIGKIMRETFPREISTRVEAALDLWLVRGDATQIHQALMNLCINARDAMPDGGDPGGPSLERDARCRAGGADSGRSGGVLRLRECERHRDRDCDGAPGPPLPALLHHEVVGEGNGAWVGDRARDCARPRWVPAVGDGGRLWHAVLHVSPGLAGAGTCQGCGGGACAPSGRGRPVGLGGGRRGIGADGGVPGVAARRVSDAGGGERRGRGGGIRGRQDLDRRGGDRPDDAGDERVEDGGGFVGHGSRGGRHRDDRFDRGTHRGGGGAEERALCGHGGQAVRGARPP